MGSALASSGLVQGHGGAHESLQRLLVDLLALVKIDGTPRVPVEAGVEEARRVLQGRPCGEGHLHDVLVRLACADQSVVRPHRNPSPLPLLDDFGIGFPHQCAEPAEHRAPPVAEFLDSRVDQLRRRLAFLRPALLHAGDSTWSLGLTTAPLCERAGPLAYGVGNLKLPCSILGHDGADSSAPEPYPDEPSLHKQPDLTGRWGSGVPP